MFIITCIIKIERSDIMNNDSFKGNNQQSKKFKKQVILIFEQIKNFVNK